MQPGIQAIHMVGPAHGDQISRLRQVLNELQMDARDVFASSGESVDRFLRERRDEASQDLRIPA